MQHTTVEIMGGLGNQLFQIFALLAYCLHYKLPFYFSTIPIQHGQRKQTYWHTPILQSLQPFVKSPPSSLQPTLLHEQGFHYQSIPFNEHVEPMHEKPMHEKPMHEKPMHVKLFGYFQSYKYFQDKEAQIYKLIKLQQTQDLIKGKTPYNYTNMIAVHFRVGDYINLQQCHPLMSIDYYTQALSQFLQDQSPALCETLEEAKHLGVGFFGYAQTHRIASSLLDTLQNSDLASLQKPTTPTILGLYHMSQHLRQYALYPEDPKISKVTHQALNFIKWVS